MAQAGLPVGARVPYALVLIDFINPLDFPGAEELAPGAEAASSAVVRLWSRVDAAGGVTIYASDNYGPWQSNFSDLLKRCARRGGVAARISRTLAPHGFLFGDAFEKGLTFTSGQTHAQRFMPELLERITSGDIRPAEIISHRMKLCDAARGYEVFNDKQEDCRKVVLTP